MPPRTRSKTTAKGPSSSQQGRPKRSRSRARSSNEAPPKEIHNPWQFRDANHEATWRRLNKKPILPTRFFNESTLRGVGLYDEVMQLVNNIGWGEFVQLNFLTYEEVTMEILSSFDVNFNPPNEDDFLHTTFRCMGIDHSWNLATFGQVFHLPIDGAETMASNFNPEEVWFELTGQHGYNPRVSKSSQLRSPALKYIHRFLVHSIFGRGLSQGVVSKHDLFFLQSMVHSRRVNTPLWMIKHIMHITRSKKGKICVGGFFTCIARTLGFDATQGDFTVVKGNASIDFVTLAHMGICRYMGNGQFWLLDSQGTPIVPRGHQDHQAEEERIIPQDIPSQPRSSPQPRMDAAGPSHAVPSPIPPSDTWNMENMMTAIMNRFDMLEDRIEMRFQTLQSSFDQHADWTRSKFEYLDSNLNLIRQNLPYSGSSSDDDDGATDGTGGDDGGQFMDE